MRRGRGRQRRSGHLPDVRFVAGKRGTRTARKEAIRSSPRHPTYNAAGTRVDTSPRSTRIFVQRFEAWGGGWGHGVGVNQTGAVGMAEEGRAYTEVPAHHDRGATRERRWA